MKKTIPNREDHEISMSENGSRWHDTDSEEIHHSCKTVDRKKYKKAQFIIGNRTSENIQLKPGDKSTCLYVGDIHEAIVEADLIKYLRDNCINGKIECTQLRTVGSNKSFRVGMPFELKELLDQ